MMARHVTFHLARSGGDTPRTNAVTYAQGGGAVIK
jgi:hypothetical protein